MNTYLSELCSIWADSVLQEIYPERVLDLLQHPLRFSHPISEALSFSLATKMGIQAPPLKPFGSLPFAEMAQLSILYSFLGLDGKSLASQALASRQRPTLASCDGDLGSDHALMSYDLLLFALGERGVPNRYSNPYFQALYSIAPKWDRQEISSNLEFLHPLIAAFGPQIHPLNEPQMFGVHRGMIDSQWMALSANQEIWFEYNPHPEQKGFEVRFIGLSSNKPLFFVFYVKADQAIIQDETYVPRSLKRYSKEAQQVVFKKEESLFSIENKNPLKMELIPLAGVGSFWDSDFLLAFEISPHDGRAFFEVI